jgi:CRP/FNR family transcriptional regulator, cyclic AMP receptor protein
MKIKSIFKRLVIDDEFKQKLTFLKGVSIFSDLNTRSLAEVYSIAYEKTYAKGEAVFEEGDVARALYIVKSGKISILKKEKVLANLEPGEFFGEMALLEEIPRTAKAVAVENSTLLLIYKVKFDGLLDDNPSVGVRVIRSLARILSSRLRSTSQSYAETVKAGN